MTTKNVTPNVTLPKGWDQKKFEGLVGVVGLDSAQGFVQSELAKERAESEKAARKAANAACIEQNGRYYKEYHPLDVKAQAIYDRALKEERAKLGLPEVEEKGKNN